MDRIKETKRTKAFAGNRIKLEQQKGERRKTSTSPMLIAPSYTTIGPDTHVAVSFTGATTKCGRERRSVVLSASSTMWAKYVGGNAGLTEVVLAAVGLTEGSSA